MGEWSKGTPAPPFVATPPSPILCDNCKQPIVPIANTELDVNWFHDETGGEVCGA